MWEMGILAEGEGTPERKEKTMTEHQRVIRVADYLQPGNKSPYHEHRMRVLRYRQRQKDKREKSLRGPPSPPEEFPKGKLGRGLRSIVNFLESI